MFGQYFLCLCLEERVFHSDICSKLLLSPKLMIEILKHQYNESLGENRCNPIQLEENCILSFLLWLFILFLFMLQGRVLHKTNNFYLFVIRALSLLNPPGCTDADRPLQTQMFERRVSVFCHLIHSVTKLFQHLSGDAVKKKPVKQRRKIRDFFSSS